ncbi:GDSL family lipase [Sphingomonas gilva]|uniref:GDSL family lipase n=1 Tax=Sphingomonas gilva TaxID=2305907 RepID=A0A396RT94_9SPHN|nr:SGNH/GDSL hydrolase family protein [Sphingomonas gilva]RHW19316.1 GDSL family lipase [Sphingomonas gilva]
MSAIDRRKLLLAGLALPLGAGLARAQTAPREESWDERWQRLLREDYGHLFRYRDENAAVLAAGAPVGIVFMGDSITQGWHEKRPDFFKAGRVGRGISGQTTPQMLVRFQPDVIDLKPSVVHIMAGTNDIAGNTGPMTEEATRDNFRAMTALAKANGSRVILASIPPAGAFPWRPGLDVKAPIASLNRWLKSYAAEVDATWIDYHPALADASGAMKPGMADDGVHPTPAGYDAMERVLAPVLARMGV